jgi:hypothetical protein
MYHLHAILARYTSCLLLFTGILVILSSCTPQKRAQRHLRRAISIYPPIVKKDTINIIDNDTIPEIKIVTEFKKDTSTSIVDSTVNALFEQFKKDYSSVDLNEMRLSIMREMKSLYASKKIFPNDTTYKVIDGFTIKIWETKDGIGIDFKKPEIIHTETHSAVSDSITIEAKRGIRERLIDWLINNILILLLLAVVLYILFRNRR